MSGHTVVGKRREDVSKFPDVSTLCASEFPHSLWTAHRLKLETRHGLARFSGAYKVWSTICKRVQQPITGGQVPEAMLRDATTLGTNTLRDEARFLHNREESEDAAVAQGKDTN